MSLRMGLPLTLILSAGGWLLNLLSMGGHVDSQRVNSQNISSQTGSQIGSQTVSQIGSQTEHQTNWRMHWQADIQTAGKSENPGLAMTWRVLETRTLNGKTYALFGSDEQTNPYEGDTSTQELRSLLCLRKGGLPEPEGLPEPTTTPGGALRGSWSGGEVLIVPNVQGTALRSQAVADRMCEYVGRATGRGIGFRMAEFHDGDQQAGWAGWDFWAEAYAAENGLPDATARYWVQINDQPAANPW
jgi:hypothetical protein